MVTALALPLGKELAEEAVDGLLEVEVTIDVKVPHLGAHLQEQVHLAGGGAEDDLGVFGDHTAGHPLPLGPHLINL